MSSGQRSGPIRRRKRRGKPSERASSIPKSTLSEIFSAEDDDSQEEIELIEVEPEAPEPAAKRAPWWSVHPVPPPPRPVSAPPPPLRRSAAAAPTPEVPPLDAVETPLSLQPPPVFDSPATDAPVVSTSQPVSARESSRVSVRLAAALFVLGASVVFGLGLGRAPDAKSAASLPVAQPREAQPARTEPNARSAPPPAPIPEATPSTEPVTPSTEPVLSLDEVPSNSPSAEAPAEPTVVSNAEPTGVTSTLAPTSGSTLKRSAASALPPFDAAVAANTINEAARRAAACRAPTDPRGVAMVMLRYAPSGRVTTAVIEGGPFAGTTVGGCIAMAFRGAHVPAFSGEPVTVRKNVTYP